MNSMNVDDIIKVLSEKGKVIAIKTDTVYGLVCNALDELAVNNIYKIKHRESKKPLSIFVKSIEEVDKYADTSKLTAYAKSLMSKNWPGALTVVLKKKDNSLNHLLSGLDSVGIRIPNDKTLLETLNKIDFPLAETSCNLSGEKEFASANEIKETLGDKIDLIIDGGIVTNNKPSTVVSLENDEPLILRPGDVEI